MSEINKICYSFMRKREETDGEHGVEIVRKIRKREEVEIKRERQMVDSGDGVEIKRERER